MDAYEQLLHVFFFFEKLAVTPWGCLDSLFSGVAARKSEKVRSAPNTLRFLRGAATQPESGFSSSPPLASNARQNNETKQAPCQSQESLKV
jgi:hypothetical protein